MSEPTPIPDANPRELALDLAVRILQCTRCPASAQPHVRAPVPPSGPVPARVVILGEAPGARENELGEPFVGPAGQLLRDLLRSHAHLDPADVAFVNTAQCFPGPSTPPSPQAVVACRTHCREAIALAAPEVVVTAGNVALHSLRPDLRVGTAHGRPLWWGYGESLGLYGPPVNWFRKPACFVYPVHHPAAALRNLATKADFADDLAALGVALRHGVEETFAAMWSYACATAGCVRDGRDDGVDGRVDGGGVFWCDEHDSHLPPARSGARK